jgi:hypothetical protein
MPAVKTKLTIEQGTTWSHGWAVTFNGAPIDETWTARSQVRKPITSADVLHAFAASVTAEGAVVIAVEPDESSAWTWRDGVYDVEVESSDGVVLRVAYGAVAVSAEVTR